MLTPQQIAHFDAFGFIFLRQAFSPQEIDEIIRVAEGLWQEDRQERNITIDYQTVAPFVEKSPKLMKLVEDDRLYQAMEQLLGAGFIWSGSEGNVGVAGNKDAHYWHSDRPGENPTYRRIKIMMYLTPVNRDNGCLRVVPASHKLPLYKDLDPLNHQQSDTCMNFFGVPGIELPYFPLESNPGDMVIFNQYLYHGVYQGTGRRRYIAMKFASRPVEEAHFASLQRYQAYVFHPDPVFLNSDSPRIRGMVEGLVEMGSQA
ncbi:MAG: hypothetical protein EXR62_14125 [Chloroflexi bacterium]|nr:hypothetical protein [Chloroflexota bacterium]